MNRRTFIETSVATAIATSLPEHVLAAASHKIDKVGVQLYTVRDAMKTDVPGTLAKVAAIGYKEMEFAGYFGKSPKEIRALLDSNGLTSPSIHVPYDVVEGHWPDALESAHVVGQHSLSARGSTRKFARLLMAGKEWWINLIKQARPVKKLEFNLRITITIGNLSPKNLSADSLPTITCCRILIPET